MMLQNVDYAKKMQKCHEYVEALEEEQKKIQVFQRELPLCLELVTQAIEACRKELSGTSTTSEQIHGGQSECSEQTTSVCGGRVFEEFIPTKKNEEEDEGEHESSQPPENSNNDHKKKSDWLRSVQLWNPCPDPNPNPRDVSVSDRVVVAKKAKVVEVKTNGGAFLPFQKEKKRVLVTDLQPPVVKSATSTPTPTPAAPAPATTTSSTTDTGGADKSREEKIQQESQSQTHRKQRRCWSPELHRRFLHALQQLGGSHVATPKQIRDHMKVDGLTNDEVKSHLQKYRLHTRRPATSVAAQSSGNPQQPQFVVVGGIWVPSPQEYPPPSDVANNGGGIFAQQPPPSPQSPKRSMERSSGRCNSPAASSSTNTATTTSSPVS